MTGAVAAGWIPFCQVARAETLVYCHAFGTYGLDEAVLLRDRFDAALEVAYCLCCAKQGPPCSFSAEELQRGFRESWVRVSTFPG